jgi:hypothetical protein
MKIIVKEQKVSIFDLLIHDRMWSIPGVDSDYLEAMLSAELGDLKYELHIKQPEGLDRWIIHLGHGDDGISWSKRCSSYDDLKDYFPSEIWEVLGKLNNKTISIKTD